MSAGISSVSMQVPSTAAGEEMQWEKRKRCRDYSASSKWPTGGQIYQIIVFVNNSACNYLIWMKFWILLFNSNISAALD